MSRFGPWVHTVLLAGVAAAVVLAGCGGGNARSARARATAFTHVINVMADPSGDSDFIPRSFVANAGKLTVELDNPSATYGPHGIAIKGHGVHATGRAAAPGGVSRLTTTLRPGRYELYSPVDGDAGMTATLTIRGRVPV